MLPQTFSIPKPLITYILENGRALRKLYKCCKYFYQRRTYCIVDKVKFEDEDTRQFTIDSKSYKIRDAEHLSNFHNIWITQKVTISDEEEDIIHQLISKIIRCDAEEMDIGAIDIVKTEFDILTKSRTVKILECYSITDDTNSSPVPIEDLLVNLVSAKDIE